MDAESELLQIKDAEIERLKGESAIKESAIRDLCAIARDKNQLITELPMRWRIKTPVMID